ncbi:MAG: divergent polysaccharide deacetylase family protein [Alphaproteobacteria bacterium]|nr:divergent polysaccharide deacetylase family protein [Alphaproteobacteria bacterium]
MNNSTSNPKSSAIGRKILCGTILGLLIIWGAKRFVPENTPKPQSPETEITMSFGEEKLSFEDYCKQNPVSTCFDNSQPTDFLYRDEPVAIIKSEEFAPQLLQNDSSKVTLGEDLIAELIEQNINIEKLVDANEKMFAKIPVIDNDRLEKLYEETLPEDVLITPAKHLKSNILPTKKPPYFGEKPVIAIVIDDMGISSKRTADIISLKAPITASFLTYGNNLAQQIQNAQNAGHEIIIHIPMEAQSNVDVAPDVLTTTMDKAELQEKLKIMLEKFQNIKGGNNHMGSKLTEDKERMLAVMEVLKEKNMFFLDSKTSPKSQAENAAKETGIAYAHRHVFIDNNNDKEYILGQLKKAENVAFKHGYAIAIGHPKTKTYEALYEWIPSLENKGVKMLHLSQIIKILNPNVQN